MQLRSLLLAVAFFATHSASAAIVYEGKFGGRGYQNNGNFTEPVGVAVDGTGSVWVVDRNRQTVQQFSATGVHQHTWGQFGDIRTAISAPGAIAFGPDGTIDILAMSDFKIWKGTTAGVNLYSFGGYGTGPGGFEYPEALAVGAGGEIYVADKRTSYITVFSAKGVYLNRWFVPSTGQPAVGAWVSGLCAQIVGGTTYLYLADQRSGDDCVLKYSTSGKLLQVFGSPGAGDAKLKDPRAVAVDQNGLVYVADHGNQRIQIFEPNGQHAFAFNGASAGVALFQPTGLAYSRFNNTLYVLQQLYCTVSRYRLF